MSIHRGVRPVVLLPVTLVFLELYNRPTAYSKCLVEYVLLFRHGIYNAGELQLRHFDRDKNNRGNESRIEVRGDFGEWRGQRRVSESTCVYTGRLRLSWKTTDLRYNFLTLSVLCFHSTSRSAGSHLL